MKKFYLKHKNQISLILNVLILIIGIYTKNYPFIIVGIILFALTFYVEKIEKEEKKIKNLCSFDFTILMRYREKPLSIFYLYFIRDCLIKKQISKIVRYLFFLLYRSISYN